jgi:hypothetical protein
MNIAAATAAMAAAISTPTPIAEIVLAHDISGSFALRAFVRRRMCNVQRRSGIPMQNRLHHKTKNGALGAPRSPPVSRS